MIERYMLLNVDVAHKKPELLNAQWKTLIFSCSMQSYRNPDVLGKCYHGI